MFFTHYTKRLLTNKSLWGWGVLYMLFFLTLGGLVVSSSISKSNIHVVLGYTATWYALTNLTSLSTLAISIAYSLLYSTHSLAYCFRYTKLKPSSYIANVVCSSMTMGVVLSVIMLAATYVIFSQRFGAMVAPSNPALAVGLASLSGIFMFALSTFLVLTLVNTIGLKNQNFVSFIPFILSYGFGFTQLYTPLPKALIYASPFTSIQDLLYHAYSGYPVTAALTNPSTPTIQTQYLALSLVAWIILLIMVDAFMVRRIKPRSIEEGRQV
ncbi:MAG: hypothetical protein QXH56_04490 [Thermoprotei archaeon]